MRGVNAPRHRPVPRPGTLSLRDFDGFCARQPPLWVDRSPLTLSGADAGGGIIARLFSGFVCSVALLIFNMAAAVPTLTSCITPPLSLPAPPTPRPPLTVDLLLFGQRGVNQIEIVRVAGMFADYAPGRNFFQVFAGRCIHQVR
ncbi:hypothetical protein GWI33_000944 [Rhynchophorus ferrugineus]|uniref:Uncharacterized protein n=1 Tax=Rhynchophorus ferrugineus TaxID=354439 RepID=A0A834IT11_RHYFE|nr:hypothetical protein GWI33_000944 [Rhynchophorus ferrugineus]